MNHKLIITIRTVALILGTFFVIGTIWFGLDYKNNQINHLQAEVNILYNYRLNEPALREQIANLKADKAELQQDLDNLNISYEADEKYINYVNSQYLKAIFWINVAELIFENNNITYSPYLGDRELNAQLRLEKLGVEYD